MAIVKATRVAELAIVRAAKQYIELGIEPVPVYPRDKAAVVDWKIAPPITRENVVNRFREGQNIGVRLGRRSAGLADVDLDCDEALRLAPMFLPPTSRISGRASSQRAHWFYRSDLHQNEDTAALTFKHPGTNEMLVELRIGADGEDHDAMTVVPPSIHSKTGENIVWYEEGDIAWVDVQRSNWRSLRSRSAAWSCATIPTRADVTASGLWWTAASHAPAGRKKNARSSSKP